jgi:hypothetical protein
MIFFTSLFLLVVVSGTGRTLAAPTDEHNLRGTLLEKGAQQLDLDSQNADVHGEGRALKVSDNFGAPIYVANARISLEERDQLDRLRVEDTDFNSPVPNGVEGTSERSLSGGKTSTWYCRTNSEGRDVASVQIWWGHRAQDGAWACNTWHTQCTKNSCHAVEVTLSQWNCFRKSDLKFFGHVQIDWGHSVHDGKWACDKWISECRSSPEGCLVTGGMVHNGATRCNTQAMADGCSGGNNADKAALKPPCDQHDFCYHGPIRGSFKDTYIGCSDLFINEANAHCDRYGLWWSKFVAQNWYNLMKMDTLATFGTVGASWSFGGNFQSRQEATEKDCLLGRSGVPPP